MDTVIIYTDGGARGNPGPAGAGVVIQVGTNVHELKKFLGEKQTNNWAEYEALFLALERALTLELEKHPLEIRMDSELIIKQLRGEYRVKEPTLKPQNAKVRALLHKFGKVTFTHIPREENSEADRLVNEAIDESV